MTFLEAINQVLRRLREDSVTASNATDYSKLIGDFVNQAIYDTEHAFDWNGLKETITITTAATDDLYDFHTAPTKIISAINETKDWMMKVIPAEYQHRLDYLDTPTNDSPYYYSFLGKNGNSSQVKLYPIPTAVESIQFLTVKHTAEYAIDSTDDSEIITVPSLPVVLNAYARAVSERGEDGGIGVNEANREASSALADAIALDSSVNHCSEIAWHAV